MIGILYPNQSNFPNQFKNLLDRHYSNIMYDFFFVCTIWMYRLCLYPKFTFTINHNYKLPYSLNISRGKFSLISRFWGLSAKILALKYLDLHIVFFFFFFF